MKYSQRFTSFCASPVASLIYSVSSYITYFMIYTSISPFYRGMSISRAYFGFFERTDVIEKKSIYENVFRCSNMYGVYDTPRENEK